MYSYAVNKYFSKDNMNNMLNAGIPVSAEPAQVAAQNQSADGNVTASPQASNQAT